MALVNISTYGVSVNSGLDETVRINAAIVQARLDGNDLQFSAGDYVISGNIKLENNVDLHGSTTGLTHISSASGSPAAELNNESSNSATISSLEITNLVLDNVVIDLANRVNAATITDNIIHNSDAQTQIAVKDGTFSIEDNILLRETPWDDGSGVEHSPSRGVSLYKTTDTNVTGNIIGGLTENGADTSLYTAAMQAKLTAFATANPTIDLYDSGHYTTNIKVPSINSNVRIDHNIIVGAPEDDFDRDHAIYAGGYTGLDVYSNYFAGFYNDASGGVKLRNGEDTYVYNNYFDEISLITYTYDNHEIEHFKDTFIFNNTFHITSEAGISDEKDPIYYLERNDLRPTDPVLTLENYNVYNNTIDAPQLRDIFISVEQQPGEVIGTEVHVFGNTDVTNNDISIVTTSVYNDVETPIPGLVDEIILAADIANMDALAAANDVVTVIGKPIFSNLDRRFDYTEGDGEVLLDSDAQIADANYDALNGGAGDYDGAVLTLKRFSQFNPSDANDIFGFGTMPVLTDTGSALTVGGTTIATYALVEGILTVTFTSANGATITTALVNEALKALTYENLDQSRILGDNFDFAAYYELNDGTHKSHGAVRVNLVATDSNDVWNGTDQNDTINAGVGNDTVRGFEGNDSINGETGDDVLFGLEGNDTIDGGAGNDFIEGDDGDDTVSGGDDDDDVRGDDGNDLVNGNDGDDTLSGNDGNDTLNGANGADRLLGYNDNDTLSGGNGNDTAYGGSGDDLIDGNGDVDFLNGGYGNDTINGGTGNDTVRGDGDNDLVSGNDGDDTVLGNGGDDTLLGGNGNDRILGDTGTDSISGGNGADVVYGGGWIDFISGDAGDDFLNGDAGDDRISGGEDNDTIRGGTGNDHIFGDAGDDQLQGEDNDDIIMGGDGDDTLSGGTGNDILNGGAGNNRLEGDDGTDVLIGGDGNDRAEGGAGDDLILTGDGANVVYGEDGDDHIRMGDGNDFANAGAGDDIVISDLGNDDMRGGDDNDLLRTGAGADSLYGDAGNDTLEGGDGNDSLTGGDGDDSLQGGAGIDSLYGGNNDDVLHGGDGNDVLRGEDGDDLIFAEADDDYVDAGAGDDVVLGGDGNDQLIGGNGSDLLIGQAGLDTISGGANSDILLGGDGVDRLSGGDDADYLSGGNAADVLKGEDGNDIIYGGADADFIEGGDGNDMIWGGDGNDAIKGDNGNDYLVSGAGTGSLNGGAGADTILAGSGDDTIIGGTGADLIVIGDAGSHGTDRLSDFSLADGDKIELTGFGVTSVNDFNTFWWSGTTTIIDVNGTGQIRVAGVDLTSVANPNDNFIFSAANTAGSLSGSETVDVDENAANSTPISLVKDIVFNDSPTTDFTGSRLVIDTDADISQTHFFDLNGTPSTGYYMGAAGAVLLNGAAIGLAVPNDDLTGLEINITAALNVEDMDNLIEAITFYILTDAAVPARTFDIQVIERDGTASGTFSSTIDVTAQNDAPTLSSDRLWDVVVDEDETTSIDIAGTHGFVDPDGDTLSFAAALSSGGALPSWMSFDGSTLTVTPGSFDSGIYGIDIAAMDSDGGMVTDTFQVIVADSSITTMERDVLTATTAGDVIYGYGGSDRLDGQDGADLIRGGNEIGTGDLLIGGIGNDTLLGEDGDDKIFGQDGDDSLVGGNGNDSVVGNDGNDIMFGDDGADRMFGYNDEDSMSGGDGNDYMKGGYGNDTLIGGDGGDFLSGENSNDSLSGGAGADRLFGGNGRDTLLGGDDNDRLSATDGDDLLDGGNGVDQLFGGLGHDTLIGGDGGDYMKGGDDNDSLDGGLQSDRLYGGNGNDVFVFNTDWGSDRVYDWSEADALDLSGLGLKSVTETDADAFTKLTLVQSGVHTIITAAGHSGDSIRLDNTTINTIDVDDFLF